MPNLITILGISGSGRKESFNTALLEEAKRLLPDGATLDIVDVSTFPLYNQDLESSVPRAVQDFKVKIQKADAILFATPEHNYTVTAVLKNAIEWGNHPDNSWDGKPAAIMSASTSPRGGARGQLALRQIMVDLNMFPINTPQLLLARAPEKFNADLKLTDEQSRKMLRDVLVALIEWTGRLKGQ